MIDPANDPAMVEAVPARVPGAGLVAVKSLLGSMSPDDLAQKAKRGQVGRAKAGRIPGSR